MSLTGFDTDTLREQYVELETIMELIENLKQLRYKSCLRQIVLAFMREVNSDINGEIV